MPLAFISKPLNGDDGVHPVEDSNEGDEREIELVEMRDGMGVAVFVEAAVILGDEQIGLKVGESGGDNVRRRGKERPCIPRVEHFLGPLKFGFGVFELLFDDLRRDGFLFSSEDSGEKGEECQPFSFHKDYLIKN